MVGREVELRLEGFRYYYRIYEHHTPRNRPPIVFVGGAFQDMSSWNNYVKFFYPITDVILVDLPGGDKADLLPRHYGVDFLAQALRRALLHAGVERAEIMSVSYGSLTAYVFARAYPEMVSRLYLSGIMPTMPPEVRKGVAHTLATLDRGDMAGFAAEVIYGLLYHDSDVVVAREKMIRRILTAILIGLDGESRRKYIENTKRILSQKGLDLSSSPDVPALVLTGEHDGFTRPEHCRMVAASFKNAVFTTIRDADHLCGTERFEVVAELARRFMLGLPLEGLEGCTGFEYFGNGGLTVEEAG